MRFYCIIYIKCLIFFKSVNTIIPRVKICLTNFKYQLSTLYLLMLKYIKQPDVSRKMQDLWVSVKLYQLTTSFVPKKVERILRTKK